MECKFFIGQKVVCINDAAWPVIQFGEATPVIGQVYTIRDIWISPGGSLGLRFEEIINQPAPYRDAHTECAFWYKCFAPTTDITIFNEILANAPKELEPV